jgi:hypothetical protein
MPVDVPRARVVIMAERITPPHFPHSPATHTYAPMWWTLTDPEGNEADPATWVGRD